MTVIGSAYVNIRAITDKLESDIRSALESITDSINIKVDADVSSATAKLDELANNRLEDQTITVDADTSAAQRSLDELANTVLGDQTIHVDADTDDAIRDLENISNISHLQDQTVHVNVETDPRRAIIDLHALANQSLNATIDVEANVLRARSQLDDMADDITPTVTPNVNDGAARARLAMLTRTRALRVNVKMNAAPLVAAGNAIARMTGARVLANDIGRMAKHFVNIDQSVPGIAKMAVLIGSIGAMAISSIGGLATLGGSLVNIINMVGLAGPGMAAGFLVGIGSLMVALKDFSKQLPEVVAQYKTLATTIRSNFWDVARDPIREMAQTLFPAFQKGLADTGSALGRWSSMVAKSIQGSLTQNGRLEKMFESLNTSIDKATVGWGAATDSILVMGEAGGRVLPRLADWFTEVSVRFNSFIKQAAHSGELQAWIDRGIVDLKRLGSLIFETSGIFNKIADAARSAGSDGLGTMLGFMTRINDALGSPEGMQALKTIFEGANTATSALGDSFFQIFGAIGSAAPAIKSAFESLSSVIGFISDAVSTIISNPEFQAGFTAMFDGIEKGFGALLPVIGTMGPKMGAFLSIIGSLAANIGGVLGAALEVVLPLITALKLAIDPLIPILGDALIRVIQALAPVFTLLADNMTTFAPIVQVVVGVIADLVVGLVEGLGPALPAIVATVLALVVGFKAFAAASAIVSGLTATVQLFTFMSSQVGLAKIAIGLLATGFNILKVAIMANPIGFIVGAVAALVAGFVLAYNNIGWFKDGVDAAMKWVGEAIGNLVSFWNTDVVPMWNTALNAAGEFFGGIGKWIGEAVANVQAFFGGFGKGTDEATGAVGGFFDGIGGMVTDALGAAGDWFGGIGTGISDAFNGVVDFISNIINTIVTVISAGVKIYIDIWVAAFTFIFDIFKNIWNNLLSFFSPLIELFSAIFTGFIDIVVAVWQVGWEIVSTIFYGIWINLVRFFTPIIEQIQTTISTMVNNVVSFWNSTWQAIGDFFAAVWNGIVAFVTPIVQSISDTITNVVNGISAAWNTAWQGIVDYFTLVWNLMVAFYTPIIDGIRDTINNVVNGISSAWSTAWNAISSAFTTIWNNIVNTVTPIINTIRTVISVAITAIQSGWNSTWSGIGNFFTTIWNNIVNGVTGFVNSVRNKIQEVMNTIGRLGSDIMSNVSNFGNLLYNSGSDLIRGLASGISDMTGWVVDKIKGVGAGIVDGLKSFFGIKSPSRLMRDQIGKQLGLGLAIGIESSIGAVVKATEKLAAAAVPEIADIMLPAVKTASGASQRTSTVATVAPVLSRESVTGNSTSTTGAGMFGQPTNGGVTNVNFNVQTTPGLNEVQVGEHAMNYMYWKLSTSTLG